MTNSPPLETDTPETDAAMYEHERRIWTGRTACKIVRQVVDCSLARKLEIERDGLRDEMKELYNCASFDWDTMPEAARRRFREVVLETAERALSRHNVKVSREAGEKGATNAK